MSQVLCYPSCARICPSWIIDTHPDPFYKRHSNPEEACHSGRGSAGYYGAEVTDCDSPISLVNATFKWIEENLKDEIDFVVWTGDSARHDNDDRFPRTDKQVMELNRLLVHKFVETFGKPDNLDDPDPTNDFVVPIVPTFGNNDILPHNIFLPGPNKWTRDYEGIWNKFVPQEQKHSFARGGWFFTEVIPNKLAVFSLNTLYFFDSNSAVDGCDLKSEPGYEHFEWLRIQLQFLRVRGMKAILTGHVPPARTANKQSWDESCHQKFTLWLHQYRDVIVTSIFGHMNIDHFMFQDVTQLKYKFKIDGIDGELSRTNGLTIQSQNHTFGIEKKAQYLEDLRTAFGDLPSPPAGYSYSGENNTAYEVEKKKKKKHKKPDPLEKFLKEIGGPWGERYSMCIVGPSVVPNYYPTVRLIHYNISGLEDHSPASRAIGIPAPDTFHSSDVEPREEEFYSAQVEDEDDLVHDLKKKKKGKKRKRPPFHVPKPPSKTSLPGPGYSPQPLSLISWRQYYANLTAINDEVHNDAADIAKQHHKHFKFHTEYTTDNDSNYRLQDLTVRSFLGLAEKIARPSLRSSEIFDEEIASSDIDDGAAGVTIGDEAEVDTNINDGMKLFNKKKKQDKSKKAKNHLWHVFVKRAYVHTKPDEDIQKRFGDE